MAERLKTLAGILEQVEQCRRLAIELKDTDAAERLNRLADELSQYVQRTLLAMDGEQTGRKH